MPADDQLIMHLYQALSMLLSLASLVMFCVATLTIFVNGRSSTERTLIGIGAVSNAVSVVLSLGVSLLQRISSSEGSMPVVFLFYALSQLIGFFGTALGLWGAVKLLNRAAQMELLLEDPDDDR